MTIAEYRAIEAHMLHMMDDSAHDAQHVYRVLGNALDIARHAGGADGDILTAACLLHDIARGLQFQDPAVDHALAGGRMAEAFLLSRGWDAARVAQVRACIETHRYRRSRPPESLEARILFDADKLDVAGAMGIARSLMYEVITSEPLYRLDSAGQVMVAPDDADVTSFFQEYAFKLERLYEGFYTERARTLAEPRRAAAKAFRDALLDEINTALHGLEAINKEEERP